MWLLYTALSLLAADTLAHALIAYCNYRRNCAADSIEPTEKRLLNDQRGVTGERFHYGWFPASYNACEVLAVHNALLLLGTPTALPMLFRCFQRRGAMLVFGLFGSSPFALQRILRSYGCRCTRVRTQQMTQCGVYLLSYWTGRRFCSGVHTVAVSYDSATYTTYNLHGSGNLSTALPSMYASRLIRGYLIEKKADV